MNPSQVTESTEILHALRGLSHDIGAAHIMLAHSFGRLKKLLTERATAHTPEEGVGLCLSQVEACIDASRGYLDDITRLSTSGTADMEPEPVEVVAVIGRVLLEQASLIDELAVQVDVRTPLPTVWCQPDRLRQVITNLLRNAILHGCDRARPAIAIHRCSPPDDDDSMAAIRIHDNGPGIDPRRRREIFLPGRRLSAGHNGGTGWGLPTARRIVERFGGSLVLDEECCSGTAFILSLPDAADAVERTGHPEPVEEGRQWRLQLDARHKGPLRHGHSQLVNVECRMTNDQ